MKKSIWIFLLAVLLPSIALGWLALRSAEEQQIILEKRTAELYQTETESAASAARALIDDERRAFNETVRRLLATSSPQKLANNFSTELAKEWPRKAVGFALGENGTVCAPPPQRAASNAEWSKFLLGNGAWLAGKLPATVYWVSGEELNRPEQLRKTKGSYNDNNYNPAGKSGTANYSKEDESKRGQSQQALPAPALQQQVEQSPQVARAAVPMPAEKAQAKEEAKAKDNDNAADATQMDKFNSKWEASAAQRRAAAELRDQQRHALAAHAGDGGFPGAHLGRKRGRHHALRAGSARHHFLAPARAGAGHGFRLPHRVRQSARSLARGAAREGK